MRAPELPFRDLRNTTTFRLTSTFGLLFVLGVIALLGLVYLLSARELTRRTDMILRSQVGNLLLVPNARLPERVRLEIGTGVPGLNYYALISQSGERVVGNIELPASLKPGHARDYWQNSPPHQPLRLLSVRTQSGETVLVGRNVSPLHDLRVTLLRIFSFSGLLIAALALLASIRLSLAPLRRLRALQEASREIAHGHLHVRMPIAGRHDELDMFAGTVNVMIDEVARVIGQVKNVTDAIAHDLRTPLTRVRSHLYRVKQNPELPSDFRAAADQATADLDIVLDRFAALLRISEIEARTREAGFGPTDLGLLLARVAELYEPLAEARGQRLGLTIDTRATVLADEKLLFEAVSNLVDNALKFTPERGWIGLALRPSEAGPVIEVADDGPGIPADERDAVFRRFYRGLRSADVDGSGLGLSVVAAVAHIHRFAITLDDRHPGLRVRMLCAD